MQPKKKRKKSLVEEKRERVQKLVDELKAKHEGQFSGPQYQLWAEVIDVHQHDSMETPPLGTMFKKQASSVPCGQKMSATAIASVVQDIPQSSCSHTLTPIQATGLKTNYIQQIKELYQLLEMGALDENDFATQKSKILRMMGDI